MAGHSWDWQAFCGNGTTQFEPWQDGYFSHCFEQLVFSTVSHAAVAVFSIYHYGRHTRRRIRGPIQHTPVLHLRLVISLLLALMPVALLVLVPVYLHLILAWVDILNNSIKILAWLLHCGFLWRHHRLYHLPLRGPASLLLAVFSATISVFINLGSVIRDMQHDTNYLNLAEHYTAMVSAGLHVCYLLTLLPSSRPPLAVLGVNIQDGENQSLLRGDAVTYGAVPSIDCTSTLGIAEDDANVFSRLTFHWVLPMMQKGKKGLLSSADHLFHIPSRLQTSRVIRYFNSKLRQNRIVVEVSNCEAAQDDEQNGDCANASQSDCAKTETLLRALNKAFGVEYYSIGILKLLADLLGFVNPILLKFLVSFIEDQKEPFYHGYIYASGLMLSTLLGTLFGTQFDYRVQVVGLKMRASIIGYIYEHSLHSSSIALSKSNTGEIVNHMSTDTDRIVNFCPSFHQFWSLPFQLAVSLYLLYQQVGFAFMAGVAFAVLLVPINRWIAVSIGRLSTKMMTQKDARVKLMNEILRGIRIVKCYAWEPHFIKNINSIRDLELQSLKGRKYLDAFCVYFWATTPVVISILTFMTYALLGHTLTAAKVFTSLALFNILIGPLNAFPWVINGLMEAWVSLKRIQNYVNIPSIQKDLYYKTPDDDTKDITISNGTFSWKEDVSELETSAESGRTTQEQPTARNELIGSPSLTSGQLRLKNINLSVKKGKFVGVVGPVGSGKSSLLQAILGEMQLECGDVKVANLEQGFGIVTQEAWIQQATVKDNILFGKEYDAAFFSQVLDGCALAEDLKLFPKAELTEIGENGVTLSGGQKARLSLARAVYQDKDIYLLDDPLAAVDGFVAKHLFEKCIMGLLKNKTRILVTHQTKFLSQADIVLRIDQGNIVVAGPPEDVLSSAELAGHTRTESPHPAASSASNDELDSEEGEGCLVMEEGREVGTLKWGVYLGYWLAVGACLSPSILFAIFLMQASKNVSDWWLSYWVTHSHGPHGNDSLNIELMEGASGISSVLTFMSFESENGVPWTNITEAEDNVKFYLMIYGSLAGANTIFTLIRAFSYAYGGIVAARVMHSRLLSNIMKAPVSFFDTTPIGRILNRFSSDVYSVDDSLPFILNILLAQMFSILGTIVVTCYGLPWFSLLLLPLGAMYYFIQEYYRHTSREIKRITSVTLSPIYSHFSETLTGLVTIRALRGSDRFADENIHRLNINQRAQYCSQVAASWLNLRLQMLGVAMVTGVAFVAVLEHKFHSVNPGLVGLAISYALSITSLLSGAVLSFTETEKQMVAVERIGQYTCDVDQETNNPVIVAPQGWPKQGVVSLQNITVQYRPSLPPALNSISFQTKAGEKIGIVGRTGAGKSSIFKALFRLVPITHGQITIDGVNIQLLELSELRSRIAIIPQDPFLFAGSVRQNLEPHCTKSDAELWTVLQRCHLEEVVKQLGGLDGEVGERGHLMSVGQRQLVCLARALLTRAKVLCIDEATASVDNKTDAIIQDTIQDEFTDHTILTIAHRINTIMNYDRIIVLSKAKISEIGPPQTLLANSNSLFYSMVHGSKR